MRLEVPHFLKALATVWMYACVRPSSIVFVRVRLRNMTAHSRLSEEALPARDIATVVDQREGLYFIAWYIYDKHLPKILKALLYTYMWLFIFKRCSL